MMRLVKKYITLFFILGFLALIVAACANMASPSGGSVDLDPPKVMRSSPGFNATRVEKRKVTIEFDENVTIKNPSENVIINPPQKAFPIIRAENRKVTVELRDTLMPNTTYTIDFTNSVVDNNEGNPLENFSYSFSTGDVVDSLAISGKVLTAENLEPVKGIYVGLHSNLEDSAFTKVKFERISRTNDAGMFTIKGVAPGKYKLYALADANRDYMYDNPAEAIAFMETIIEPTSERAVRNDTIFVEHEHDAKADNAKTNTNANQNKPVQKEIDSIKTVEYTRFLPDNIVLRSFKSGFQRQFLQKSERSEHQLSIFFGAPTKMPLVEPLSFDKDKDWSVLEKTPKNDTLIYWVKDPSIMAIDTMSFRVTYLKTDSLNQSVPVTDTLNFVDRTRKKDKDKEKEEKKKRKEEDEPHITFLTINNNLSSTWDTHKNIYLEFGEPIIDSLKDKIVLQQKRDSLFDDIPYQLQQDSLNPRRYTIKNKWAYGAEYQIRLDSAAIYSIYGLWNNKLEQKFKVKNEDQYAQLAIWVDGIDSIPSFMEILDKSDKPIRKSRVINNAAVFKDLDPGIYYFRVVLDKNNNGVWDTGDYDKKLQPEAVYYMGKAIELKANFEVVEDSPPWRIDITNMDSQKPLDITKQKPEDKEARRKKLEEQDAKNQKNNRDRNNNSQQGNQYNNGRNNNGRNNNQFDNSNNYNNQPI